MRKSILIFIFLAAPLLLLLSGWQINSRNDSRIIYASHFNEGTGTSSREEILGTNGTVNVGCAWVSGKYGPGLISNGGTGVNMPLGTQLKLTTAFTITFWTLGSASGWNDGYQDVIKQVSGSYGLYIWLQVAGRGFEVQWYTGSPSYWVSLNVPPVLKVAGWHFVAVSNTGGNDAGAVTLFVDTDTYKMSQIDNKATAVNQENTLLYNASTNITMDEIVIYSGVLPVSELSGLYRKGKNPLGRGL